MRDAAGVGGSHSFAVMSTKPTHTHKHPTRKARVQHVSFVLGPRWTRQKSTDSETKLPKSVSYIHHFLGKLLVLCLGFLVYKVETGEFLADRIVSEIK